jgi:hypothetical protein
MRHDNEGKGCTDELSPAHEQPNAYVARCRTIAQCHVGVHAVSALKLLIEKALLDISFVVHLTKR